MTRDRLTFLGALLWHLARAIAVLFVAIRIVAYIDGLERRGQAGHDTMMREHAAFLAHHEKMMRDHETATADHRAMLQRLGR
jgi:hypothetical protein